MGAFKLGKMTFGSLFKKPETIQYPLQVKPQPAGLKGHIALDAPACILCGMCERSCTTNCITVDKAARLWKIDRLQCVQCGYCVTVCPKKCLSMDPNYAPATTVHAADEVAVPEQPKPEKKEAAKDGGAAAKAAKAAPAADAPAKAAPSEPKPEPTPAAGTGAPAPAADDPQLDALIALMDDASAGKVREALAARR